MKTKMFLFAVVASAGTVLALPSASAQQVLHGHEPEAIARLHLQSVGRLPATNRLHLAIGLPLRNKEALNHLLEQLYDPASTNYHHYLTPQQFTDKFGPTEQDYQAVIAFAKTNGLTVTGMYPNRVLVDVNGSVADIEKVFHVTMHIYQHPKEHRTFYAPDTEPSLDLSIPLLHVSGLDNYIVPHPGGTIRGLNAISLTQQVSGASGSTMGSGPSGAFMGKDFRNAYVPGVTLDGSGQEVGLLEFYGYYTNDIANYEFIAGLPNVSLTNVSVGQ